MGMDWVLEGRSVDRNSDMIGRPRESATVAIATEPIEIEAIHLESIQVEAMGADASAEWLKLTRLAYSVIGDRQVAEELVQESYIRLHKAGDRVENRAAFLRVTVINRCKTYSVRRSKERAQLWRNAESTESTVPREIDETLLALRNLGIKYRTVLALRYYEDLSIDEIAEILNVRPGTIKSLIHRGLAKLRTELERQTHESPQNP
jgi:RNA polymerase sigma factor (sigma-70 family)